VLLVIVSNRGTDAVSAPEVPVIVTVALPAVALLAAVNARELAVVVVAVAGENVAVTPVGNPLADRLTPLAKPFMGVTTIVDLPDAPDATKISFGAAVKEKLPALTVNCIVSDWVMLPEVPVIVIVAVPDAAALLAENVATLELAVGLGEKTAVTPLGSPDALRVTLPENPYCGVTVKVPLALAP